MFVSYNRSTHKPAQRTVYLQEGKSMYTSYVLKWLYCIGQRFLCLLETHTEADYTYFLFIELPVRRNDWCCSVGSLIIVIV